MRNPVIDGNGNTVWHNEKGQRHRLDGPAMEFTDGSKTWWVCGNLHRIDGPAVESSSGDKYWYVNGEILNGPLDLLKHSAKLEDIAEYLTPREIAQCRT